MKRSIERRLRGLAAAAVLAAGTSHCVTDHDALAKRDAGGDGGTAGTGGGRGGSSGGGTAGTGGDGTAGKYTEPAGHSVVTFMHGVVDSERVAFCFARAHGDGEEFVGEPAPASGLDFGQAFHAESLPDLDFSEDAITPYVIGGDLDRLDGLDCEQAVALAKELTELALPEDGSGGAPNGSGGAPNGSGGAPNGEGGAGGEPPVAPDEVGGAGGADSIALPDPPALRVGALPAFPAGTLSSGFSTLLVAEGCLGGPWFVDKKKDDEICGAGYSGDTTLAPSFVVMSRQASFNVGFQALNASRASGPLDAVVSAPLDGVNLPITIANEIPDGKVEPVPANTLYSRAEYGLEDPAFRVRFIDSNGEECAASWNELLERGGLDAIEDGKNYVVVALGPRVGIGSESWWNRPTIGIVAADP